MSNEMHPDMIEFAENLHGAFETDCERLLQDAMRIKPGMTDDEAADVRQVIIDKVHRLVLRVRTPAQRFLAKHKGKP